MLTSKKISVLRKAEKANTTIAAPEDDLTASSYSNVLLRIASPGEMFCEIPRELLKKQNDPKPADKPVEQTINIEKKEFDENIEPNQLGSAFNLKAF